MICEEKLKNYASNFLESEIEYIDKLLKKDISEEDKHIFLMLKTEYEHDLDELEKELRKEEEL